MECKDVRALACLDLVFQGFAVLLRCPFFVGDIDVGFNLFVVIDNCIDCCLRCPKIPVLKSDTCFFFLPREN